AIHKGGDKEELDNYRGITLLSSVAKLFEVVVNTRLYAWAKEGSKLRDERGGFRPDTAVRRPDVLTPRDHHGAEGAEAADVLRLHRLPQGLLLGLEGRVVAVSVGFAAPRQDVPHAELHVWDYATSRDDRW